MTRPKIFRFKIIHYYLIPITALVVWWGMLIAMLSAWALQGHPIYEWRDDGFRPVYISDIGATNLQPLFISCSGFQAIFFVGTLIAEYVLRKQGKLQVYTSTKQPKFQIIAIIFAIIGQLGILFVSIFNTVSFNTVHLSMVGVFIAGCFFACLFNFFNTFIFGFYPVRLTPTNEHVIFGKHRWANVYMVSFFMKVTWLICAAVFAIFFGVYMQNGQKRYSSIFEWTISFFYGLLLVMWAIDLFPAAIKHYNRKHNPEYTREFNEQITEFETPEYKTPEEFRQITDLDTPELQTPEQYRYA